MSYIENSFFKKKNKASTTLIYKDHDFILALGTWHSPLPGGVVAKDHFLKAVSVGVQYQCFIDALIILNEISILKNK